MHYVVLYCVHVLAPFSVMTDMWLLDMDRCIQCILCISRDSVVFSGCRLTDSVHQASINVDQYVVLYHYFGEFF